METTLTGALATDPSKTTGSTPMPVALCCSKKLVTALIEQKHIAIPVAAISRSSRIVATSGTIITPGSAKGTVPVQSTALSNAT